MISISVIPDIKLANTFLVKFTGAIKNPRSLNDALGRRLARDLQTHFRQRNNEPNKMGAEKTNFWSQVADATSLVEVSDKGAVVGVKDARFRIHLYSGTIKPTGGRRFLTIPLISEARGMRVAEYESRTGRKLFRLPNTGVLFERSDAGGEKFLPRGSSGVIRGKGGYRKIAIGHGSKLRAVYALKSSVTIKADTRAIPPITDLAEALQSEANAWAKNIQL